MSKSRKMKSKEFIPNSLVSGNLPNACKVFWESSMKFPNWFRNLNLNNQILFPKCLVICVICKIPKYKSPECLGNCPKSQILFVFLDFLYCISGNLWNLQNDWVFWDFKTTFKNSSFFHLIINGFYRPGRALSAPNPLQSLLEPSLPTSIIQMEKSKQ